MREKHGMLIRCKESVIVGMQFLRPRPSRIQVSVLWSAREMRAKYAGDITCKLYDPHIELVTTKRDIKN